MTRWTQRTIRLSLAAMIAAASAFAAVALAGGGNDGMAGMAMPSATSGSITPRAFALDNDMRRLWEDHVTWTRLAIISLTTQSPDTSQTVARLLRNQADIGNAIKPYYGAAAGAALTKLLREHILIAADLVAAAMKADTPGVAEQESRWTANADQIARFLAGANPANWKLAAMKTMLHEHLKLTGDEAVARIQHRWAADVRAYNQINAQALMMADMLSSGIIAQFPTRFS
jgi:hypothetical protein